MNIFTIRDPELVYYKNISGKVYYYDAIENIRISKTLIDPLILHKIPIYNPYYCDGIKEIESIDKINLSIKRLKLQIKQKEEAILSHQKRLEKLGIDDYKKYTEEITKRLNDLKKKRDDKTFEDLFKKQKNKSPLKKEEKFKPASGGENQKPCKARVKYSNNMTANQIIRLHNITTKKDWKLWLIKNKPTSCLKTGTGVSDDVIRDVLNAGKEIFLEPFEKEI